MNVLASMIYSIHLGSVSLVSGSFKTLELPSSVDGFGYSLQNGVCGVCKKITECYLGI